MRRWLGVYGKGESLPTLILRQENGATEILYADPLVRPDVERWLARGYLELVREPDGIGTSQRVTLQSEPEFLPRIGEGLKRQFKFWFKYHEETIGMTKERVAAVCLMYADSLKQSGYEPERCTEELNARTVSGNELFSIRARHVAWMCHEVPKLVAENRVEKAMRWLGFIQGALWTDGHRSLEEMKKDNMPPEAEFDRERR